MLKWSRVRLYLSILTCEGLFATLRERIQWAPRRRTRDSGSPRGGSPNLRVPDYYDYSGSVHVHSTYSDGAGTVPEIALAANRSGLDFVVLCDHATLQAREDGYECWHGRTLVVVGTEVATDTGHLLALGVSKDFLPVTGNAVQDQQRIVDLGGVGFIALPCDLKDHWRNFELRNAKIGLEVFNLSAIARTKINLPALALVWQRYKSSRPQRAFHWVAARPSMELRLWDNLMQPEHPGKPYREVVGIGSVDAHAVMKFGGKSYPFPTYDEVFRTLRTHILLPEQLRGVNGSAAAEDVAQDLATVNHAIASGHSFFAYDNYGDSTGFTFHASGNNGERALMGDSLTLGPESRIRLVAQAPRTRSFLRLFRDGRMVAASRGGRLEYDATRPGVYRVEAHLFRWRIGSLCLGAKPWVFSNPIYLQPCSQPADVSQPARPRASRVSQ